MPDAPENFTAITIDSTTVQLSWNMPDVTNGIILSYIVEYTDFAGTSTIVYSRNQFAATVTDLNEDTLYSFSIYSTTSAGAGPNSTVAVVTLEDSE